MSENSKKIAPEQEVLLEGAFKAIDAIHGVVAKLGDITNVEIDEKKADELNDLSSQLVEVASMLLEKSKESLAHSGINVE